MIGDASRVTEADLRVLARAFALLTFHEDAVSDHENSFVCDLAERFVSQDRAMLMSLDERVELATVCAILENAWDDAAPPVAQVAARVSA